jgi:hypothetical protein
MWRLLLAEPPERFVRRHQAIAKRVMPRVSPLLPP